MLAERDAKEANLNEALEREQMENQRLEAELEEQRAKLQEVADL